MLLHSESLRENLLRDFVVSRLFIGNRRRRRRPQRQLPRFIAHFRATGCRQTWRAMARYVLRNDDDAAIGAFVVYSDIVVVQFIKSSQSLVPYRLFGNSFICTIYIHSVSFLHLFIHSITQSID